VVFGAFFATVNIARYIFNRVAGTQLRTLFPFHSQRNEPGYREPVKLVHIRLQLGSFCRMGLELLVVADVLETILKPLSAYTIEELAKIAIIVSVRTGLAWFLGNEVKEVEEEMETEYGKNVVI